MKIAGRDETAQSAESRGLPPVGDYTLQIVSAEEGTSTKGNPQVVVDLQVTEPAEYAGSEIRDWCPGWKVRQVLDALGELAPDDEFELEVSSLEGKTLRASVVHKAWKNKMNARIGEYIVGGTVNGENGNGTVEKPPVDDDTPPDW